MKFAARMVLACILLTLTACDGDKGSDRAAPSSAAPATGGQTAPGTSQAESAPPASTPVRYLPGSHYVELPQQVPTVDRNRVEVTEVFWYGCSHCFAFEPMLEAWVARLPEDVVFQQSPAMWDEAGVMELHARMFYTAKALGIFDQLHQKLFDAMNLKKKRLQSEAEIAEIFVDNGIDKDVFHKTFNSFGVTSAVRQAEARQRSYQIQGTPELVVNGKYRVTGRLAGGHEDMLKIATFLVDKERAALHSQ